MTVEEIEFFVAPKLRGATNVQGWLVYRRSLTACVDAATDVNGAIAKAVKLAEFCMLGGQTAQVHLRQEKDGAWRTVWCPKELERRYP